MKIKIFSLVLLLLLIIACDPSYRVEVPLLSEKEYLALPLEQRFEIYKKASGYIDTPDYIDRGIAKEGEKAIPLILNFIENSRGTKKIDAIYLLLYMHKDYSDLKNTKVEEFLKQKIKEKNSETDKYSLESYEDVLKGIQAERTMPRPNQVMLTPGSGKIPAFYSDDEDIVNYVTLIKEKILQETKMTQRELDARFSIVGYVKGEKMSSFVIPIDKRTVAISFVAKTDWVEISDDFEFKFLDEQGKKLSLEQIKKQINVPFYFNIKKLIPLAEVEKIVAKKDSRLEVNIPPLEPPYYNDYNRIRLYSADKIIALEVFGTINEQKNQCIQGRVNLLNGDILTGEVPCLIY